MAGDAAQQGLPDRQARRGHAPRRGARPPTWPGHTTLSFRWRVVPLPAAAALHQAGHGGSCWYPPHLDRTRPPDALGLADRPGDPHGSGRAARAVDIYDIDGFLTTPAEIRRLHTTWQASTLAHPKAVCYLTWPGRTTGRTPARRPPGALPGERAREDLLRLHPQERWVDFRQLRRARPMLNERIAMCASKGFDAVELDDIDSFDPPSTTGFHLTPGDAQNYLAYAFNQVHRDGMTVLWKNSPLLAWWGARYTDGAVVEECYTYGGCFAARAAREPAVRHHLHRAARADAMRLGRVHGRPHGAPADGQMGRRGRVRRRPLRVQSGAALPVQAAVRHLLPSRVCAYPRLRRGQVRRRPRRPDLPPVPGRRRSGSRATRPPVRPVPLTRHRTPTAGPATPAAGWRACRCAARRGARARR